VRLPWRRRRRTVTVTMRFPVGVTLSPQATIHAGAPVFFEGRQVGTVDTGRVVVEGIEVDISLDAGLHIDGLEPLTMRVDTLTLEEFTLS
jgi:hypothetical protein